MLNCFSGFSGARGPSARRGRTSARWATNSRGNSMRLGANGQIGLDGLDGLAHRRLLREGRPLPFVEDRRCQSLRGSTRKARLAAGSRQSMGKNRSRSRGWSSKPESRPGKDSTGRRRRSRSSGTADCSLSQFSSENGAEAMAAGTAGSQSRTEGRAVSPSAELGAPKEAAPLRLPFARPRWAALSATWVLPPALEPRAALFARDGHLHLAKAGGSA